MDTIWQDLRFGARTLVKHWGFTVIALLTLALGIGANTAIFSVINAVLLRPLPFAQPERLFTLWNVNIKKGGDGFSVTYPDFFDWRTQQQSFEYLAAFRNRDLTLTGVGDAVRLRGAVTTSDLFPLLGVSPALGRTFTPEEERAGNHAVVLSDVLWRRRFNADRNVVGRTIALNGQSYTVIGVMPPSFVFPYGPDVTELWVGTAMDAEGQAPITGQRGNHTIEAIGRLKPGVTLGAAQAEMSRVAEGLGKQYPEMSGDLGIQVVPFYERIVGNVSWMLWVLLGAVGCVLLIACANVANLLLARAVGRQREIAIRAAMGANRWRVIRQLLTESVLISLLGGIAGLLLASWGTDFLLSLAPRAVPRVAETALDGRVLSFTLAVSLLTGILFGLAPALSAVKHDLVPLLKEGSLGAGGGARGKLVRNSLLVAQIAIAFTLLICAGLLIHSFWRLQQVNPGFDPHNVLTFRLSLPTAKYAENSQIESFYQRLQERLKVSPGVTSASAVSVLPLSGQNSAVGFSIDGVPTEANNPFPHESFLRIVRPGYFRTLGIPLLQGRDFDERDLLTGKPVVIINETLARKYFPDQNPLGRRINPSFAIDDRGIQMREIIGVVKDVQHASLSEPAGAECYASHLQVPAQTMTTVLRTAQDPRALMGIVRKEVAALDADLPVYNDKTLEDYLALSVAQPRFNTMLLTFFAGVALLLTAIGLYGVMSYTVSQHTREIGIRLALGAQKRDVLTFVVGQGMLLTLLGIGIGIGAAFALTRLLREFLFGVSAADPLTFGVVAILLAVIALLACYIPARRATRVDPMIALRYE